MRAQVALKPVCTYIIGYIWRQQRQDKFAEKTYKDRQPFKPTANLELPNNLTHVFGLEKEVANHYTTDYLFLKKYLNKMQTIMHS